MRTVGETWAPGDGSFETGKESQAGVGGFVEGEIALVFRTCFIFQANSCSSNVGFSYNSKVNWVQGDATDSKVVEDVLKDSDAAVHAIGTPKWTTFFEVIERYHSPTLLLT